MTMVLAALAIAQATAPAAAPPPLRRDVRFDCRLFLRDGAAETLSGTIAGFDRQDGRVLLASPSRRFPLYGGTSYSPRDEVSNRSVGPDRTEYFYRFHLPWGRPTESGYVSVATRRGRGARIVVATGACDLAFSEGRDVPARSAIAPVLPPASASPPAVQAGGRRFSPEELTLPIRHLSCDMTTRDRRSGRLRLTVAGGQAFSHGGESRHDDIAPGIGRTGQTVAIDEDSLGLLPNPERITIDPREGQVIGRIFARLRDRPAARLETRMRYVDIDYNRIGDRVATVATVPGGGSYALGFCAEQTDPQPPLRSAPAIQEQPR